MDEISVEVQGASIIVTKPGTDFVLIYEKHPGAPNLVLTHSWVSPTTTSPAVSEFRARAIQAAVERQSAVDPTGSVAAAAKLVEGFPVKSRVILPGPP